MLFFPFIGPILGMLATLGACWAAEAHMIDIDDQYSQYPSETDKSFAHG